MGKYAIIVVVILAAALIVALVDSSHEKKRWRDSALTNARKRLQKDQEREKQVGLINQKAAKNIERLNAAIEDLQADNLRLKRINEVYRKQIERKEEKPSGLFECFHCLSRAVVWDCDYDFSDFGYEGPGVVQTLHCSNCGAEITYAVSAGGGESDG